MSMNWLEGVPPQMADLMTEHVGSPMREHAGRPMVMPVFVGHKLIVAGGRAAWTTRPPPTSSPPAQCRRNRP